MTHAAWADDATGNVGLVFTNLHPDDPTTVALDVDAQQTWGLDLTGATITRTSATGSNALGSVSDDNRISTKLELPPRTVVLVEIGR